MDKLWFKYDGSLESHRIKQRARKILGYKQRPPLIPKAVEHGPYCCKHVHSSQEPALACTHRKS